MSFHLRFISEFYAEVPEVPGFFVLDALSAGLFVQNKKTADRAVDSLGLPGTRQLSIWACPARASSMW
ncbi:MAG: hypothetical protein BAA01_13325 [Bacillus thermozeamaize]|uniref:Uncharacterized protein n=1 Tax=Bacillus thermozeamaize TaxID=230954 RepID=A0A1Y3PNX3_9BACI|nr:MAG: hypothetical protein BAA01_13325 [Bacillus thermozeamaize]